MTDQIPAGLTRDEAQAVREWANLALTAWAPDQPVAHAARVVLAALPAPPRPTMADMTEEERDECRWMQCDVQGQVGAWLIVAPFDDDDEDYAHVVGRQGSKSWGFPAERITPRPDLPRMEWTSDEKPAPALPEGWRLADHPKYGRVIVTTQTPNDDGRVYYVLPSADPLGFDWLFCDPDELTYLDQEDDQ